MEVFLPPGIADPAERGAGAPRRLAAEAGQVRPGDCLRQGSVLLKLMFCRSQGERLHRKLIFYVIQGEAFPLNNII